MLADPLIGQRLANFRLERLLGRGGMGQVYYAWDVHLQRPVAVKVIDTRFRNSLAYARRFIDEARLVATWRHEHIIQVYYAGQEQDLYFFVMEYIDGQSLGNLLDQTAREGRLLAHSEVLRCGQAIAAALDYAHARGVIHRDVKPQNILLTRDGRVVLTDFGLALHRDQGAQGEVVGSIHYTAPEQAHRSSEAVPQSDLYSLGVILYEMLTGMVPFDDPSPTSIAIQHLTQTPPSPCALNPALPQPVELVLLRSLSKMPESRYPTGTALMEALQQALLPEGQADRSAIELPPPPPVLDEVLERRRSATPILPDISPTPGRDPLIGQYLDEYRLTALIGQGGMGRVYRGFDTQRNRRAAVKVVDPSCRDKPNYFRRFEREAQAIASLQHPNIIQLYHYRETDGLLYLAMQYVEGRTLQAVLSEARTQRTVVPPAEALRYLSEICQALDYMHANGVIHRDLKPANILLDEEGHVVLTDFGLALLTEVGTQGEIFGSPHYMAPEQIVSSAKVVPQSDLYAVGVMLYEMFTGRLPFQAGEPLDVAMLQMSAPPPPPRQIRAEITPEVEAVILKTLEKEPGERFTSGAALVQALQLALGDNIHTPAKVPAYEAGDAASEGKAAISSHASEAPFITEGGRTSRPPSPEESRQPGRSRWLGYGAAASAMALIGLLTLVWVIRPGFLPVFLQANGSPITPSGAGQTDALAGAPAGTPTPAPASTEAEATSALPAPAATASAAAALAALVELTPEASPTATATPNIRTLRIEDSMPMMLIPAAAFDMGAAGDDPNAEFDERPQHRVSLDSYYIDQYEVSVDQYAVFLNYLGKHWGDACLSSACAQTQRDTPESHMLYDGVSVYQPEPGYENFPMNNVTWYGAQAYCEWVGARLPTEAEWEFAARGWTGRLYPWGNEPPDHSRAVFDQNDYSALLPVDGLPEGASFFGVYNLAGSVWEWAADWYLEEGYADQPPLSLNPTGPSGRYRSPRVLRGGSWKSPALDLRASARKGAEPLVFKLFGSDVGFRCARPAEGTDR